MPGGRVGELAIHASLDTYERAIDALFDAVASAAPKSDNQHQAMLDEAIEGVIREDALLSSALDEVYQHKLNARRIAALQAQSADIDAQLDDILVSMASMQERLMQSAKVTAAEPKAIHKTVDYAVLISYAERIAKYARAPNNLDPAIPLSSIPNLPWPSEDMMRRGVLSTNSRFSGLSKATNGEATGKHDKAVLQDPTAAPVFADEEREAQGTSTTAQDRLDAPPAPVPLDLDLFDPENDD